MTKEQAIMRFRILVGQYGLRWTKDVPRESWEQMQECNKHLSEKDRREALGLE